MSDQIDSHRPARLAFRGTVDFFVHNVFNYPTLAESYRTASLDDLNLL